MRRCVLISNTPTLAVVGGTYLPESGQLTSKAVVLHWPEWLGDDIGELLVRAYVPEFYLLSLDLAWPCNCKLQAPQACRSVVCVRFAICDLLVACEGN